MMRQIKNRKGNEQDFHMTPYFIMHTVFSREKTMAKQDILFGTTVLFYKSMGLQGNIPWKSKMENSNQGDLFGI